MTKMLTYVQKARHATGDVVVGHEPITKTETTPAGSETLYLKKDGQYGILTGTQIPPDAALKAVYNSHGALPAPQYKQLHDYVYKNLQINLSRFGYNPQQIEDFTQEIVGPPPPPPAPPPPGSNVNLTPFPVAGKANPLVNNPWP
jgi:hypothetical protein